MPVEVRPILSAQPEIPMPERLIPSEILSEIRQLDESWFETESGKSVCREFYADGYHVVGWSDGTRCAVRLLDDDGHTVPGWRMNQSDAIEIYQIARKSFETHALEQFKQMT